MSHVENDKLRESFAEAAQEMSHREKVMTLLGFFFDSRKENLDALLVEAMYHLHGEGE